MRSNKILVLISLLVLGLFIMLAIGSTGDSGVDRGANDETAEVSEDVDDVDDVDDVNRYSINETYNYMGLEITIGEVLVESDRILVGMTLNNTRDRTLSFYPNQGDLVAGNLQVSSNMFMSEGDLGGDIRAGVEKSGVIHFTAPEDREIPDVSEISLHLGNVSDMDAFEFSEFEEVIVLE